MTFQEEVKQQVVDHFIVFHTIYNQLEAIGKTMKLAKWVLQQLNNCHKDTKYEIYSMLSLHDKNYHFSVIYYSAIKNGSYTTIDSILGSG